MNYTDADTLSCCERDN